MRKTTILFFILFISTKIFAQGNFSGDLMLNQNFFMRDTNIKASGNPLYDNYLAGSEGWLSLRYNVNGFSFAMRGDVFNNSNLNQPSSAMTGFGLGAWSVSKSMKDLTISLGYIYDQVGSGILFRSYEDRGLLIDNALVGLELKYKLTENINLKGFTGQQKHLFSTYAPVIKGLNAEGDFNFGQLHLMPGIGVLNRTLDQQTINQIASSVQGYRPDKRFEPMYNMYAGTVYNMLSYKNLSWYAEVSLKSHEAFYSLTSSKDSGLLVDRPGNIEYTSITWGKKGIALSLTGKRTQDFVMLNSPNETAIPNSGMLNWQPVVAILRPERLMSLYTPASQNISELATTANLLLSPNEVTNLSITYTHINTLDNVELFREGYADINNQSLESWKFAGGFQYLEYNLNLYQSEFYRQPIIFEITPFCEVTYKLNEKQSIRFEGSYTATKQYYGSWAFGLIEYNFAPKFSISASDMYNMTPNTGEGNPLGTSKANHYYNVYTAYTKGANRFSIAYVKQVAGINCTGGVCRYEPAFSGIKATVTSSF